MRCLAVLTIAFVALVSADEEWKPLIGGDNVRQFHEKCVEESGLTSDQIERMKKFERPDEKEVHEYIHCNMKKFELFADDGGFNTERLMTTFDTLRLDVEKAREVVTKCVDSNEQKSPPAVWAFRGVDCMMNNKMDELLKEAQDKLRSNSIEDEV